MGGSKSTGDLPYHRLLPSRVSEAADPANVSAQTQRSVTQRNAGEREKQDKLPSKTTPPGPLDPCVTVWTRARHARRRPMVARPDHCSNPAIGPISQLPGCILPAHHTQPPQGNPPPGNQLLLKAPGSVRFGFDFSDLTLLLLLIIPIGHCSTCLVWRRTQIY